MSNKFGPWATLINTGVNPQLSSFWRRRLMMLVPASRTSPLLSRGNVLLLFGVGVLALALPTVFFTPAEAQEKKPGVENMKPSGGVYSGTIVLATSGPEGDAKSGATSAPGGAEANPLADTTPDITPPWKQNPYSGLPAYVPLWSEDNRKLLKLSDSQDEQLRRIAADFQPEWQKYEDIGRKSVQNQPPEQMKKEAEAFLAEFHQKALQACKRIEELLTPGQLSLLKNIVVQSEAAGLQNDPAIREKLNLSAAQIKEMDRLARQTNVKIWQHQQEATGKLLALLSPEQMEKMKKLVPDGLETAMYYPAGGEISFSVYPLLERDDVRRGLGLSDQQQVAYKAISEKCSKLAAKELRRPLPTDNKGNPPPSGAVTIGGGTTVTANGKAESDESDNRTVQMGDQMRKEIAALLTPEQLAAIKRITWEEHAAYSLLLPKNLKDLGVTDEQKKEINRLNDEKWDTSGSIHKLAAELGEQSLNMLAPAQREQFKAMIDQRGYLVPAANPSTVLTLSGSAGYDSFQAADPDAATGAGGGKELTKFGAGTIIMAGPNSAAVPVDPRLSSAQSERYEPSEFISLPAYSALVNPKTGKQIGLNGEQEKKLREIAAASLSEEQRLADEITKTAPGDMQARQAEFNRKLQELRLQVGRQIEQILTPRQLADYKKLFFPMMSFAQLFNPEVQKAVELTPAQVEKVKQLPYEMTWQRERDLQETADQALKLLRPDQVEKLRAEIERRNTASRGSATWDIADANYWRAGNAVPTSAADIAVFSPAIESDADATKLILYENLGVAEFRQNLGLSPDQERRLKQVAADALVAAKQSYEQLMGTQKTGDRQSNEPKLPFQASGEDMAQKVHEYELASEKLKKEFREKVEALLTPQQSAAVKENVLRTTAASLLSYTAFQVKIGMSDEQKMELAGIHRKLREKSQNDEKEMFKKALDILTPQQQQKMREELDRRGW
jgi:hypothetical protein